MIRLADENTLGRDSYRRGMLAYEARLRAMLNAPIQGIASGVGSLAPEAGRNCRGGCNSG
jgi:hypothetical protein